MYLRPAKLQPRYAYLYLTDILRADQGQEGNKKTGNAKPDHRHAAVFGEKL